MITAVLGAPGSGKSVIATVLRPLLADHVVLDWDAFMDAADALAGRDVRRSPRLWPTYRHLVWSVVDAIRPVPVVVFTVCTPDELNQWTIARWVLLDCDDQERRRRLAPRMEASEIAGAVADAAAYRALAMDLRLDTTDRPPEQLAFDLARLVRVS